MGAGSLEAVVERFREAQKRLADPAQPLIGWGFDPIYFGERRCDRSDLDAVSRTRAVAVMHASGHILNVNTAALEQAGLLRTGITHPGIPLGADGLPTGELKGPDAMGPALAVVGLNRSFLGSDEFGIRAFGQLAVRAGVTTATDLAATLGDGEVDDLVRVTGEADYPLRIVPLLRLIGMTPADAVQRALALRPRSTEQLRLGRIKVVVPTQDNTLLDIARQLDVDEGLTNLSDGTHLQIT
jgi:predicted amidohydrolase YtcJ